ncbi:MAG: RNA polymerase sigma factor [Aequorivita sp.]
MDYTNNQELNLALRNEDEKAYTFLVDQYHQRLCIYAYSLIKSQDLAEDIVQNVFIRVWKQRDRLKPDLSIKSLLYKSVYNEFIDQYRKQKSVLILEKKYIEALDTIVENEDGKSLERLIDLVTIEIHKLPPKCKETFLLSKKEGLTNIEIAEYLNVSVKSVEAHITKAFSILRDKLGNKMDVILFLLFGYNKRISH